MPELAGSTAQWVSPGRVGAADDLVSTTSRDTDAKCRGVSSMDVNEFSLRGGGAHNAAA